MFKYIVKRLLLALLILFGVSMIIYSLVRLMPVNFITDKFQPMILQGTIKQEDEDRMLDMMLNGRSYVSEENLADFFRWFKEKK